MTDARLRQFSLTGGRARAESDLPLEAPITAPTGSVPAGGGVMPEHREIVRRCATPQTVVDLSAVLGVPVGVVRVLALDLADQGLVTVHRQSAAGVPPHRDLELLEEALDGIANL
jgi:hypothetical protein